MHTTATSSDIKEENYPTDKYNYVRRVPHQNKKSNCTKKQVLQKPEYPESYYQVAQFMDYIEADSEKGTGFNLPRLNSA
jgi:hypothetical protein